MNRLKIILIIIVMSIVGVEVKAMANEREQQIARLATMKTARDSISVLYNIYDLSSMNDRKKFAEQLYQTATRAGVDSVRTEALAMMATNAINDTATIDRTLSYVNTIRQTKDKEQLRALVQMVRALTLYSDQRFLNATAQSERINRMILDYSRKSEALKKNINSVGQLFSICVYLTYHAPGNMLRAYLDDLRNFIHKEVHFKGYIMNLYYDLAAIAYAQMSDSRSVADVALDHLNYLDSLERTRKTDTRRFINYDLTRYHVYRNLMSAYKYLPADSVEKIYEKLLVLVERNSDCSELFYSGSRTRIYHFMSKGDYRQALNLIKDKLQDPVNVSKKRELLKMCIEAADTLNDLDAEIEARKQYAELLRATLELNDSTSIKEINELSAADNLNLSISLADIQHANEELVEDSANARLRWAIIIGVLLLLSIVFMYLSYIHTRRMTAYIAQTNKELKAERDMLAETHKALISARERSKVTDRKKTEFIHNISHELYQPTNAIIYFSQFILDSLDGPRRKYLAKFINIVESNAYILQSLVNDVLDSAEAENGLIKLYPTEFELSTAINNATYAIRPALSPDVKVSVRCLSDGGDKIIADQRRLEQMLINVIGNAAKFTTEGYIDIDYTIDRNAGRATITVSDSGVGIPEGKEEVIFERFSKLSSTTQGLGLGLYVCRLMARNMGATVSVDKSYRKGARFVITLPIT